MIPIADDDSSPSISFEVTGIRYQLAALGDGRFRFSGRDWRLIHRGTDSEREELVKRHGANVVTLELRTPVEPNTWSDSVQKELHNVGYDVGRLLGYGSGGIGWLYNWRTVGVTDGPLSGGPGAMVNEPEEHDCGPLGFREAASIPQLRSVMPQWIQHALPRLPAVNSWMPFRAIMALLANGRGRLQFMTDRCLSLASALEMLRHNFKTKVLADRGLIDSNDYVIGSRPPHRAHFRWVHEQLCAELRISEFEVSLPFIVEWRNLIIHEGEMLGTSVGAQLDGMLYVSDYLDTIILAAFHWDGYHQRPWRLSEYPKPFVRTLLPPPFVP